MGNKQIIYGLVLSQLLLFAILPNSVLIGSTIGGLITLLGYVILCVFIFKHEKNLTIYIEKYILFFALTIFLLISLQIIFGRYESLTNVGTGIIMMVLIVINIFIIPVFINKSTFIYSVIAISVLLAIIAIIFNSLYHLDFITDQYVWWNDSIPVLPFKTPHLMSITYNPNTLGRILFFGTVFSLFLFYQNNEVLFLPISTFLIFSLYLTQNRSSWLATIITIVTFLLITKYKRTLREIASLMIILLIGIFFIPIYLRFGLGIPIELSGRISLSWAGIQAIGDNPLLGYGFGSTGTIIEDYIVDDSYVGDTVHNSFLRVFLLGGVFAGSAYIAFLLFAIFRFKAVDNLSIIIFSTAIGSLYIQLFEAHLFLGHTIISVLTAITFGYLITGRISHERKLEAIRGD